MEGFTTTTFDIGWSISIWKESNYFSLSSTPFAYCLSAEGPNNTYVDLQMTKDQMKALRDRINTILEE